MSRAIYQRGQYVHGYKYIRVVHSPQLAMTLPSTLNNTPLNGNAASNMADEDTESDIISKPTSTALWRRWRPNKLVPRLAPRFNRRRRRSSTAFPLRAEEEISPEHPPSPRSTSPPPPPYEREEEITTPRNDNHRETLVDTDTSFSLTPPATSPAPLVVSAKRLGSEVRRNHSKRRKGRLGNDKENVAFNVTTWRAENEVEDEVEEGLPPLEHLSPDSRAQRYWQWCYGTSEPMPQSSWSASRAPPSKSWCVESHLRYMLHAELLFLLVS